jgi:hypothetical protein
MSLIILDKNQTKYKVISIPSLHSGYTFLKTLDHDADCCEVSSGFIQSIQSDAGLVL